LVWPRKETSTILFYNFSDTPSIFGGHFKVLKRLTPKHPGDSRDLREFWEFWYEKLHKIKGATEK